MGSQMANPHVAEIVVNPHAPVVIPVLMVIPMQHLISMQSAVFPDSGETRRTKDAGHDQRQR